MVSNTSNEPSKCSPMPYGPVTVIAAGTLALALVMSFLGAYRCNMVTIEDYEFFDDEEGTFTFDLGMGVFTVNGIGDTLMRNPSLEEDEYDKVRRCITYSSSDFISYSDLDVYIKTARKFGGIVVGFSWPILVMSWTILCCGPSSQYATGCFTKWTMATYSFLMGICTILMTVATRTSFCDNGSDCHLGKATAMTITACLLWWITGCFYLGIQRPGSGQHRNPVPTQIPRPAFGQNLVTATRAEAVIPVATTVTVVAPCEEVQNGVTTALNVSVDNDDTPMAYAEIVNDEEACDALKSRSLKK